MQLPDSQHAYDRPNEMAGTVARVVSIRPFLPSDEIVGLGSAHGPERLGALHRRTLVATSDGGRSGDAVVGAGTLVHSARHPDVTSTVVDVRADHRGRGIGTALLAALELEATTPLMLSVEPGSAGDRFLEAAGFVEVADSATCRFEVGAALDALAGGPAADARSWGDVVWSSSGDVDDELAAAYDALYADRHRWAGRSISPPGEPWIGFAGPCVEAAGVVQSARLGDAVIAVCSLHRGPFADGADAFLAPTGVIGNAPAGDRAALLGELLAAVLTAGARAGIETVNAEIDRPSYDDLAIVLDRIPTVVISRRSIRMRRLFGRPAPNDI